MPLDDLVGVIETLKGRIASHRGVLAANEYRTRVSLIDPLLCALGWDTADPNMVMLEYEPDSVIESDHQVDYALLQDDVPLVLVEAKRANLALNNDKHLSQLFDYFAKTPPAQIGILTNGVQYRFYSDLKDANVLYSKPFLEIDITNLSPKDNEILECFSKDRYDLKEALRLSEERQKVLDDQRAEKEQVARMKRDQSNLVGTQKEDMEIMEEWTSLTEIEPYSKMPAPSDVKLPDGKVVGVPDWKSVFVEVAEHLVRHGILIPDRCPITPLKSFGIDTHQYHPAATRTLSNGLYWRCHGGAASVKRAVTKLMGVLGQDPSQVWLKTG